MKFKVQESAFCGRDHSTAMVCVEGNERYFVKIMWKTPEQKTQAIEAAKIALRLKAELLTKKKRC